MEKRFKNFTVLMTGIGRSIHKIKTEEMAEFELKSSHVSCLYYLYKADSLTAKELCDICGEDKANISRSLKFLEQHGYLTCNSRTEKRYQCPIALTDQGRAVGARIAEKIDRVLEVAGHGLSEEHRAIMYSSLSLIYDNLRRICDGYDG